jgi:UDP-N-acetylglucosamine 3-dehydrogenase
VSERFAVVGCGTAAVHIHLPLLRAAGVDVTTFASRSRSSAEAARAAWSSGTVVDRWEDAVTRDDVDAVVITTPNAKHRDVAVAALRAGKHVLVDKPMARTIAEADEMIAAAETNDRVLVPFQNSRFMAPFAAAHDMVARGAIGEITGVRAAFGHGGPQAWAPRASWFFDKEQAGGGCLIDLGVHVIDLVRFVTRDDIVEVSALLNGHPDGRAGGVEHDAQLLVRLARGAIGTIHASWSSRPGPDHQLTLVGTDGTLHLDSRTPLTHLALNGDRERVALPAEPGSPLDEFLAAVRGEHAPSVTSADGRAAVAVVEAAYRAADDGKTVRVS